MNTTARTRSLSPLLAALALAAALPGVASAQSALDTSQATAFMGSWAINFDSPQGAFVMDLELTNQGGKVAASIGSAQMGGMQNVTNVTLSGANLVLRYDFDAQGQIVPVAFTLSPNGDASLDFADGMFVMPGAGAKK